MQNAYEGPAFGAPEVKTFSDSRTVDLRGASDWRQIAVYETWEYKTGSVNAQAMVSLEDGEDEGGMTYSNDAHAEVRLIAYIAGNAFLVTTSAVSHKMNLQEAFSPGHFRHVIEEGHMPDSLEIQARARRMGDAEAADDTFISTETLQLSTWVSFRR